MSGGNMERVLRPMAEKGASDVYLSANSPILDGYQAPVMVGASVARLGRGAVFGLTGSVGLTSTAPDLSLGEGPRVLSVIKERCPSGLRSTLGKRV